MKKPCFLSLSLNQSPVSSPRGLASPSISPSRTVVTTPSSDPSRKVAALMTHCTSLQLNLSSSLRDLQGRLTDSLSELQRVKKELHGEQTTPWKHSNKYRELRAKMQRIGLEEEEKLINEQVALLRTQASSSLQKRVKLTISKTQIARGKKARTVQQPLFIPASMLGSFATARQLGKNQRAFGSDSAKFECDEAEKYIKEEIFRYEKERKNRMLGASQSQSPSHRLERAELSSQKIESTRETCPLLAYMEKHHNRKPMGQFAAEQRHLQMEEKMRAIQPSAEVRLLARKYLPKSVMRTKRKTETQSPQPVCVLQPSNASLNTSSSESLQEDRYIVREIRRELANVKSLLKIASVINKKNREDFIKKAR